MKVTRAFIKQMIRESVMENLSSDRDAEYLKAVADGDMDAAQKMVDEAAKKAGYNVGPVFNGGTDGFNTFRVSGWALPVQDGIYFTDDAELAEYISRLHSTANNKAPKVRRVYVNSSNPLNIDATGRHARDVKEAQGAKWNGYDSVVIKNIKEYGSDSNSTTTVVFNPNQIKSADPVTYDDQGNPIPLSQRFNEHSDDIRKE
jgi:hypothetical protein